MAILDAEGTYATIIMNCWFGHSYLSCIVWTHCNIFNQIIIEEQPFEQKSDILWQDLEQPSKMSSKVLHLYTQAKVSLLVFLVIVQTSK